MLAFFGLFSNAHKPCLADEFDNAALAMMERSADAYEHNQFKDVVVRVANVEIYYKVRSIVFPKLLAWTLVV